MVTKEEYEKLGAQINMDETLYLYIYEEIADLQPENNLSKKLKV